MKTNSEIKLTPSPEGKDCIGNGTFENVECQCEECDFFLDCFPEYQRADKKEEIIFRRG